MLNCNLFPLIIIAHDVYCDIILLHKYSKANFSIPLIKLYIFMPINSVDLLFLVLFHVLFCEMLLNMTFKYCVAMRGEICCLKSTDIRLIMLFKFTLSCGQLDAFSKILQF